MFKTLSMIAEELNDSKILWGVGASVLLNQHGLIDMPNDIDILVDVKDIDKVDRILKRLGSKKSREATTTYSTKYFYEYLIDDVDIDVMAELAINFDGGTFQYIFDESSIDKHIRINGVQVPFTSLEEWYIIYQLIPNRKPKVKMIEEYFVQNGIDKPALLERVLKGEIPIDVRERTIKLLDLLKR